MVSTREIKEKKFLILTLSLSLAVDGIFNFFSVVCGVSMKFVARLYIRYLPFTDEGSEKATSRLHRFNENVNLSFLQKVLYWYVYIFFFGYLTIKLIKKLNHFHMFDSLKQLTLL